MPPPTTIEPRPRRPPPPSTPPGFILIDRHIEKNAGSTFRELLFQSERRGLCMYWGYQQRSIAWTALMDAMEPANISATHRAAWIPPRVCMEAHSHIDYGTPWLTRLEQLRSLRAKLAAPENAALRTQIVLLLRLRQPLRLYVSFYLWTVAERQARNPDRFGRTFADWAQGVPNLQTELLLSSKAAFAASFAPVGHPDLKRWQQRWATPARRAERRRLALHTLDAFDVLGTTERFAESTLLAGRYQLNWSVFDSTPSPERSDMAPQPAETCMRRGPRASTAIERMWWCRNPMRSPDSERRRVHARICPNMTACRELIRRIAPVDHELYARAVAHLDAAVKAAGSGFADDLRMYQRLALSKFSDGREAATARMLARDAVRCGWTRMRNVGGKAGAHLVGGEAAERHSRRLIWKLAPNFTARDRACVPGDNAVMRLVWSESRYGGRVAPGWPACNLQPVRKRDRGGARTASGAVGNIGGGFGGFGGGASAIHFAKRLLGLGLFTRRGARPIMTATAPPAASSGAAGAEPSTAAGNGGAPADPPILGGGAGALPFGLTGVAPRLQARLRAQRLHVHVHGHVRL